MDAAQFFTEYGETARYQIQEVIGKGASMLFQETRAKSARTVWCSGACRHTSILCPGRAITVVTVSSCGRGGLECYTNQHSRALCRFLRRRVLCDRYNEWCVDFGALRCATAARSGRCDLVARRSCGRTCRAKASTSLPAAQHPISRVASLRQASAWPSRKLTMSSSTCRRAQPPRARRRV